MISISTLFHRLQVWPMGVFPYLEKILTNHSESRVENTYLGCGNDRVATRG